MKMASDGGETHLSMSTGSYSASEDLSAVETLTREGSKLMSQKRLRHSIRKYTEAYELAESLNDKVALQSCACNLGAALIAKGDAEKAIRYLKNALPQKRSKNGKKIQNESILADVHYNLGLGYSVLGDLNKSVKHLNLAIELFIACTDLKGFAEGYHQLGEQYMRKRQLQTAAKCFEESSKAFEKVGDFFAQSKMLLKFGESLAISGMEVEGLQVAKVCDAVCEKLHVRPEFNSSSDIGKKARCFHDLGILYSKLNAHESATRWYEAALINMRSSNIPSAGIHEARILENYGLTCNIIQQYSRAVQLHKEAASIHGSLGNSTERGWCFYHLAEAYRNLGQGSDAERTYHVASQIFEDSGQAQWQWKVMIGLGDLSYDRKNLDGAIRHYKQALKQLHKNQSEETLTLENHVMEKLVMALQVQRAGMVRMASYKSRKPVLINPDLEKMVLESMSSALQQSITFEDRDIPKLPTLESTNITHSSDSESATFSQRETLLPLSYGMAIPSPIMESPKKSSSLSVVRRSESGKHLVAPRSPGTTRRRKHVGRRRKNSYEIPVTNGIDSYSSATDLSIVDAQTAEELREAATYLQQEVKLKKKKRGLKKIVKQAKDKIAGGRRRSENDDRPENVSDSLEYTSDHHKRTSVPAPVVVEMDNETGGIRASTSGASAGEYTTQEYHTTSPEYVNSSGSDEDVFDAQSGEERQRNEEGDNEQDNSESESEQEGSQLSSSEDEWNEEDLSVSGSSQDSDNSSVESHKENLNATYMKPLNECVEEPLYSTIRSQKNPSRQDTLYETLNSTAGSYKLPGTMPTRKPDTPPMIPPPLPESERPKRSERRRSSSSSSSSSSGSETERYPPSPIMTQYTRAYREQGLMELGQAEIGRKLYTQNLTEGHDRILREAEEKKRKQTSTVCSVM